MSAAIATLNIPAFGQRWEEHNGILIGIQHLKDQFRALIMPEGKKFDLRGVELGTYGKKVEGADSVDDGEANTLALANGGSELCQQILEMEDDRGNKGLFLGSSGQHHIAYGNEGARAHFDKDDWYWTSTQYSSYRAWYQWFVDGGALVDFKDYSGSARPLRSVIL